jgi:hypothetical protein
MGFLMLSESPQHTAEVDRHFNATHLDAELIVAKVAAKSVAQNPFGLNVVCADPRKRNTVNEVDRAEVQRDVSVFHDSE